MYMVVETYSTTVLKSSIRVLVCAAGPLWLSQGISAEFTDEVRHL